MPLRYPVSPATILLCDYSAGGFLPPEMVKRRPAIVVSPRLPHRDGLCTVVPLSGSPSGRQLAYEVELRLAAPLPHPFQQDVWWAKCDMLATVGFERLDLFRTGRDQDGKRKYLQPKLGRDDFTRIQNGILSALGMSDPKRD